jgi:hypothetical protein
MSNLNETKDVDLNNIIAKWGMTGLGVIGVVVLVFYLFNFHYGLSIENDDWGAFGGYFGGILSPVIALFAFYLVSETYKLQKRELKLSTDALNNQVKLAALTAFLNSNLTRIGLLESEKLSLLESELRNPKSNEVPDVYELMRSVSKGGYGTYVKSRKDFIVDEINGLKKKNIELETQIEEFSKNKDYIL